MLPDEWSKKIVDIAVDELTDEDIQWADMVFISGMFIQLESARQIIDRCKKLNTKTVGGGPLFTAAPEMFDDVDHLVLNEGELTIAPFLEDLRNGDAKHIYTSDDWADMTDTPAPRWDLIDLKKYAKMCVQYSRGCPFGCDFCDVTKLFGNRMRLKTADQLIAEFDNLYENGWRGSIFVVDDNFIGNKTELKKNVLPAMIKWMQDRDYPFQFTTQVSINISDDDELMELMANAGFEVVFIGIETPDEASLKECNKGQNRNRDLVACVKRIQQFGLQVQAGFIVGFDSDQPSIFENMINFIQSCGIITALVGLLQALRGTALYKRMEDENRLLDMSSGDNTDTTINFIPKMDHDELVNGFRKVISTIYSPRKYCERTMTLLKNYKPIKKKKRVRLSDIKTLVKSMWRIGICTSDRRYFWKPILWTLFRKPQLLNVAITASIYGLHFKRIFRAYR
jgi:radical SAM superfamily enzyme YgiQ (UPF0313 family)